MMYEKCKHKILLVEGIFAIIVLYRICLHQYCSYIVPCNEFNKEYFYTNAACKMFYIMIIVTEKPFSCSLVKLVISVLLKNMVCRLNISDRKESQYVASSVHFRCQGLVSLQVQLGTVELLQCLKTFIHIVWLLKQRRE